jgi:hypothetical protein
MVECWGSSLTTSPRYVIVAGPADQDTNYRLQQGPAEDRAWRDEQAQREWISRLAALQTRFVEKQTADQRVYWEEPQREQSRRGQSEPYRVSNFQPMRYGEESPNILGNINRILENASQNRRAYEQRVREQRALGSQPVPAPALMMSQV